jgi:hydroxymethylbilane synthase
VPIGAHATVREGRVRVQAIVASPDGTELIRGEAEGPIESADATGRSLGADLLERGARRILDTVYA